MESKYGCIIDSQNNYREYVVIINGVPQSYDMQDGDTLVNTHAPSFRSHAGNDGFVKPRWNGSIWIEGATDAELEEWLKSHPEPPDNEPTEMEKIRADLDYVMLMNGLEVDPK